MESHQTQFPFLSNIFRMTKQNTFITRKLLHLELNHMFLMNE